MNEVFKRLRKKYRDDDNVAPEEEENIRAKVTFRTPLEELIEKGDALTAAHEEFIKAARKAVRDLDRKLRLDRKTKLTSTYPVRYIFTLNERDDLVAVKANLENIIAEYDDSQKLRLIEGIMGYESR